MLLEKESHGCTEQLSLQVFVLLTQSTRFSYKSCLLSPGVHGFPGSGIMSLFITKCLVTNISGEQNVEMSHIWIQTQWGDLSTHPFSNIFSAVKFRFDCWFFYRFTIPCETPSGREIMSQGCICSLLKNKTSCQINRNQSRELLIW